MLLEASKYKPLSNAIVRHERAQIKFKSTLTVFVWQKKVIPRMACGWVNYGVIPLNSKCICNAINFRDLQEQASIQISTFTAILTESLAYVLQPLDNSGQFIIYV